MSVWTGAPRCMLQRFKLRSSWTKTWLSKVWTYVATAPLLVGSILSFGCSDHAKSMFQNHQIISNPISIYIYILYYLNPIIWCYCCNSQFSPSFTSTLPPFKNTPTFDPTSAGPGQRASCTRAPRFETRHCSRKLRPYLVRSRSRWRVWYPLVNCHITMENHHFQWENPLFLWPFSIAMLNYQRVNAMFTLWVITSKNEIRLQNVDPFRISLPG